MGVSRYDELPDDRELREIQEREDIDERAERFKKELRDDMLSSQLRKDILETSLAVTKAQFEFELETDRTRENLPEPVCQLIYVKQCSTCDKWYTMDDFRKLPLRGYLGDAEGRRLELRDCRCENQLGVEVKS